MVSASAALHVALLLAAIQLAMLVQHPSLHPDDSRSSLYTSLASRRLRESAPAPAQAAQPARPPAQAVKCSELTRPFAAQYARNNSTLLLTVTDSVIAPIFAFSWMRNVMAAGIDYWLIGAVDADSQAYLEYKGVRRCFRAPVGPVEVFHLPGKAYVWGQNVWGAATWRKVRGGCRRAGRLASSTRASKAAPAPAASTAARAPGALRPLRGRPAGPQPGPRRRAAPCRCTRWRRWSSWGLTWCCPTWTSCGSGTRCPTLRPTRNTTSWWVAGGGWVAGWLGVGVWACGCVGGCYLRGSWLGSLSRRRRSRMRLPPAAGELRRHPQHQQARRRGPRGVPRLHGAHEHRCAREGAAGQQAGPADVPLWPACSACTASRTVPPPHLQAPTLCGQARRASALCRCGQQRRTRGATTRRHSTAWCGATLQVRPCLPGGAGPADGAAGPLPSRLRAALARNALQLPAAPQPPPCRHPAAQRQCVRGQQNV
jgi:hypothetical protein